MCTPGSHSQTWPIPFCRSKIHILPEMAPEGQHLVTEHNCSQQRESLSDSRISNGCRNAAFRADLYIRDLIRHKSHYFPVTFVVFSQFVLSVEAERLKAALFSASGIRLLIPRKKIISNPAPGWSSYTCRQSQQQECEFLGCSAGPWEQGWQRPVLFGNICILCCAHTSKNLPVPLHYHQE